LQSTWDSRMKKANQSTSRLTRKIRFHGQPFRAWSLIVTMVVELRTTWIDGWSASTPRKSSTTILSHWKDGSQTTRMIPWTTAIPSMSSNTSNLTWPLFSLRTTSLMRYLKLWMTLTLHKYMDSTSMQKSPHKSMTPKRCWIRSYR